MSDVTAGHVWGQVVLGPPGSGKTTYCRGTTEFLQNVGRDVILINLDPANDPLPFEADVDIAELIKVSEAMEEFGLGPNGAMMYAMEFLEVNVGWLVDRLRKLLANRPKAYLLFDLPGQVELFTHHRGVSSIFKTLQREFQQMHLAALHLVDATHCVEPSRFISAAMLSLSVMLRMELPHLNVLSKADVVGDEHGALRFYLDEGEVEFGALQPSVESGISPLGIGAEPPLVGGSGAPPACRSEWTGRERLRKLTAAISEVVEQYGLVSFKALSIQDKESLARLQRAVDKANGCPPFVFSQPETTGHRSAWGGDQDPHLADGADLTSLPDDPRLRRAGV